jgi:hypothetical protein
MPSTLMCEYSIPQTIIVPISHARVSGSHSGANLNVQCAVTHRGREQTKFEGRYFKRIILKWILKKHNMRL